MPLPVQVSLALALRSSAGTAFRAPTLNQVEAGIATTSRQFIARIGTFKPIRALGNPDLDPEVVSTFNAGAILDHEHWLTAGDRLYVRMDYWRYAFEKPLVPEPYVRVLDLACPREEPSCDTDSPHFDRVHFGGRRAVSDISAISVSVVNGPDVDTQGVDLSAEYSVPMGWGEWTFGVAGTRTLAWEIDGWEFGPAYDAIGRLNYDTPLARTVLDWKARAWLNVRAGDLNVRWTVHHTAASAHDLDAEPEIDAHATHDVTIAWTSPDERWTLDATVWNATDRDPPRVYRQLNYDPLQCPRWDRARMSPRDVGEFEDGTPQERLLQASEQFRERFFGADGPDRGALKVPSVPGDDVPSTTRACRRDLHGIFEVGHGQASGVPYRVRSGLGDFDEPCQLDDEVTRAGSIERGPHQVVEVGDGVPRDERRGAAVLEPVDDLGGGLGVGASIECEIDEYVGVDQDQRYFSFRAAYRASSPSDGRNRPRHRDENDGLSSRTAAHSDCSTTDDSETPRDRA